MSEYTNYYIVRSSDKHIVKSKLNEAKIHSVLDADESQSWFSDNFKSNKPHQWVVVGCPGSVQSEDLLKVFDEVFEFYEDEDRKRWFLFLFDNDISLKLFFEEEKFDFTEQNKKALSRFLNKDFNELQPYLQCGKGGDFLNFMGIPSIQMFDQGLLRDCYFDTEYSVFSEDFDD